ncbi:MAG: hypothetical protein ACNA8L_12395 [Luteolibacter sp.]
MLKYAVTLVHKAAMEIGLHAIRSFARHFKDQYRLDIHTDGSPDGADERVLLEAAEGMATRIVRPQERAPTLKENLRGRPHTRALLDGVGYNAKLELPMSIDPPYFYFDSDIVWLRPVKNLSPTTAPNAFSTESWSWYNGVANDSEWIRAKTPRRVNSGFYHLAQPFPFDQMEDMLARGLFDQRLKYNTDQEIMAYLYPAMEMYHPDDLKRSRRGIRYDLATDPAAALHFPGGMWRAHLDQMEALLAHDERPPIDIRYQDSVPLSRIELLRMRLQVKASDSPLTGKAINLARSLLRGKR